MPTLASAQVAIPKGPASLRLLCYLHGTITMKTEPPSSMRYESDLLHAANFVGVGQFLMVQPDYLGLGDSTEVIHPYLHIDTLASASIDAILATQEFALKQNLVLEEKIYLSGYSEGGLATLAALHARNILSRPD